jgi:uncharacterized phage protein (TIGR02218 family)
MTQADALAWLTAARSIAYADLYTFTLADGSVWRFTSADVPLTVNGATYRSAGLVVNRGSFRTALAVEVQTLALTLVPDRSDATLAAFVAALDLTIMRGCRVEWRGWYGDDWATPRFTLLEFVGRVAGVEDDEETTLTCMADLALLNTKMPRHVYQSACLWQLFEPGCGLSRAAYADSASAAAGGTRLAVVLAASSRAAGYYAGGILRVDSGAQAGAQITVRTHGVTGGLHTLALTTPLAAALDAGTALTLWPGCDRAQTTCDVKFNNLTHFRGMPYVPVPETAT